jgi:predicted PhzF superfamily epimerase YddE/YHI9
VKLRLFQIDAFTSRMFAGNPAAVCPLERWLADTLLQAIATENNLSETAFFVPAGETYELRWFTPVQEVDLCGHATLASAFVVFRHLQPEWRQVRFTSQSGVLTVVRDGERMCMDFPAWEVRPCVAPAAVLDGLGRNPIAVLRSRDYVAVYGSEEEVRTLKPNLDRLAAADCLGIIATAPGRECDFVLRFFAPRAGVGEDPVTGSAQCSLVPYWAERLGKSTLHVRQLSRRGGELLCTHGGERVQIAGHAVQYLEGTIEL